MKLKKIASLMLAGIMAVSMLAGCKSATEPTEEPEVTPVTGAAATVNGELDANKDKINFTDNTVLTNLLTNYYKENPIDSTKWNAGKVSLTATGDAKLIEAANKVLGVAGDISTMKSTQTGSETYLDIYYVNSDFVTKEDALRMAGQYVDGLELYENNEVKSGGKVTKAATHDYSYTGSIAAIEAESKGGTESVWVVGIVVTQTASAK